jgi:hypothetical protein
MAVKHSELWKEFWSQALEELAMLQNRRHVTVNPLKAELNPICHLLALLRAHHILHVSRIRIKGPAQQNQKNFH